MKSGSMDSDAIYGYHAEFCKMFANPNRLRILGVLSDGEKSVGEISEETGIPQPTVSQHLRKMLDRGVVVKEERGTKNYYEITDPRIVEGMNIMKEVLVDRLGEEAELAGAR
ncbi:MAG: hypothetical protein MAG715_00727 [Methanonatronarchaeales archaeon]|nr:hypothetical protein [Methanonatronarchaeales archaeon]